MTQENFLRQNVSQALISSDRRAWEAHMKKRERDRLIDSLNQRVESLEKIVIELQSIIKERVQ